MNLATSTATVEYDPGRVRPADFIGAIEELGYGVPEKESRTDAEEPGYRRRFLAALIFAAPVLVLGMLHRLPWVQLALTLPVVFYAGAPFYTGGVERAAAPRGQHEHADRAGHRGRRSYTRWWRRFAAATRYISRRPP